MDMLIIMRNGIILHTYPAVSQQRSDGRDYNSAYRIAWS